MVLGFEEEVLHWIRGQATPSLDAAFLLSHELGTTPFCTALVLAAVAVAVARRRYEVACVWAALGISTYVLQLGLKLLFARPRPELWARLLSVTSYAFPSGHAIAAATFYPLIAWSLAERWPRQGSLAYGVAVAIALFVGLGRLYLGIHWPSDVVAGWMIGAIQTLAGVAIVRRWRQAQAARAAHSDESH
jgi:undecaprenyl-diphosphatase